MLRIITNRYHYDLVETQLQAAIYQQIMKLTTEATSPKSLSPGVISSSIIRAGDVNGLVVEGQKAWLSDNSTRKTRMILAPSPLCLQFHLILITQLDLAPYF
jgi:hypothetical protein